MPVACCHIHVSALTVASMLTTILVVFVCIPCAQGNSTLMIIIDNRVEWDKMLQLLHLNY